MDDHCHHQSAIISQNPNHQDLIHGFPKKKKPRSFAAFHIIRVALYMLKPDKSKQHKTHKTTSAWKKLLDSMRPFHHVQCTNNSPPRITGPEPKTQEDEQHIEVFTPPLSPAKGSRASSSSTEPASRYASAVNLRELDECDENEEEEGEGGFDENGGDEMIDVKAEQFIAQFYEQMRLQREAYAIRA